MKTKFILIAVALVASFLPSCTVGYGGRQYGCGVPQGYGGQFVGGYGQPGFGSRPMGPRSLTPAVQDNGTTVWSGAPIVRFPARNAFTTPINGYTPIGYNPAPQGLSASQNPALWNEGAASVQRFVPSGRSATCPKCHAKITNAPQGTFPCQRCGGMVSN